MKKIILSLLLLFNFVSKSQTNITGDISVDAQKIATVNKIKNIPVPTPTIGVLTYISGHFSWIPGSTLSGSGTLNYIQKIVSGTSTIGNSSIFDDGTSIGIGTNSPGAILDVQGNTGSGQLLFQLYSKDWSTSGERSRFSLTQGELFIRSNTYTFHASSDGGNANMYLRGDNAGFSMVSNSLNTTTFDIVNSPRPNISAPYLGQIFTDAYWAFGSSTFLPTAQVHAMGIDNTSSNFTFKGQDNLGNDLFVIRNDGVVYSNGGGHFISNTAYGSGALINNSTDGQNTAFGQNSQSSNISGIDNVSFGAYTLNSNQTGSYNVAIGTSSLYYLNGGGRIVAIGSGAAQNMTTDFGHIAIGFSALGSLHDVNNTSAGAQDVAIGIGSLSANIDGLFLTAVGANSLGNSLGTENTAIGGNSLGSLINGDDNVGIGTGAGGRNTGGQNNVYIGAVAGVFNVGAASDNVMIGFSSGYDNNNTGDNSGTRGGRKNVFVGSRTGQNSTSNHSIFLGYNVGSAELNDYRFIVGDSLGTLLYGRIDTLTLGIGTVTPNPKSILDLESTTQGFLIPRMTTIQKLAIPLPPEGIEVYDLTLHQKSYYNGTTWINY